MREPWLSIVVPTVGRRVELVRLLASIHSNLGPQANPDVELLVIDQNADDRVGEALSEVGGLLGRCSVRHHRAALRSLSYAKNQGIRLARGQWVTFADDDSWFPAGALTRMAAEVESESGIVFGHVTSEDGRSFLRVPDRPFVLGGPHDPKAFLAPGISAVFPSSLFFEIGLFDEELSLGTHYGSGEDTDMILRALRHGTSVRFSPELVWHHPVLSSAQTPPSKLWSYGLGFGATCRKNGLWFQLVWKILKQAGGALVFLSIGRIAQARAACAIALGRLQGALTYRGIRSTLGTWRRRALPVYRSSGSEVSSSPRVHFGTPRPVAGAGGPWARNQRMIQAFGNATKEVDIVYANSSEMIPLEQLERIHSLPSGERPRIVLNQNGMYFPAWYKGNDVQRRNDRMRRLYQLADEVIFQSEFARESFALWAHVSKPRGQVLLNSVPPLEPLPNDSAKAVVSLTGVFQPSAEHVLIPALKAMLGTPKEMTLRLIGPFARGTTDSAWFSDAQSLMRDLESQGKVERIERYDPSEIPRVYRGVSVALHLHDLDCCPNAVVERMALGIPHVFVKSGGTPELVGEAGIGLTPIGHSRSPWEEYRAVDVDQLRAAIGQCLEQSKHLGALARKRYDRDLSWNMYLKTHRELFRKILNPSV